MGGPAEETDTVRIVVDGVQNSNDDITVEFNADPWLITAGKSVALSWKAIHADICSASDGWAGDKSAAGSEQVFPTKATSYVLTCKNSTKSKRNQSISSWLMIRSCSRVSDPSKPAYSAHYPYSPL